MKLLCVCQYGHSRSVAMCRALHGRGHEAVAAGVGTAPSAIVVLSGWADAVVIMSREFTTRLPAACLLKLYVNDVGPDRWSNPYHPELAKLCEDFCDRMGW